ncbi:Akirin-1 [Gracilariopsis chorda]|uniref:Akirin-1 n=1 Tax=Gracilariopsis chorda TaxID=448386 RepID=A0A2V3J4W6_9FLOR|nr:Akirin-1 [Gracilariopsis chorda]|eukprot:PXF49478.1 Akirin-1 [Gracilariopsis chorda]
MSGVATLKLRGAKRHFDEMAVDLPLPPQACSPSRFVIRQPPLKRGRCTPSSFTTPTRPLRTLHVSQTHPLPPSTSSSSHNSTSHNTPTTPASSASNRNPLTPSTREKLSEQEIAALAKHVPKRLKKVVHKLANGHINLSEKLFNVHDLAHICRSILSEKEANMNEHFAKILNDRLAEQFRDFTKFNEDYVTRQLRGKDYAYLS